MSEVGAPQWLGAPQWEILDPPLDQQHHTLQLRILDLIYDILQNWNNAKI